VRTATSQPTKPLRVLLLENSESHAELITHELKRSGMTTMIGRVNSAESFTVALRSFAPDVVLSDTSLTQLDSFAALDILRAVRPTAPFIIVTSALSDATTVAAIRAGAEDLILRSYLNRLVTSISDALAIRRPLHNLTERQLQVLRLVAEGYRTRDSAKQLGVSVKTVESHRGQVMKRLRVRDIVQLVRYAIRVGLIPSTF